VEVTVLADDVREIEADVRDGAVLIDPDRLPDAIGWDLKPEGLCRGDVCVPVRARDTLFQGDQLDLAAVGRALDRPVVIDGDNGVVVLGVPAAARRSAVEGFRAPPFELPDLDGRLHPLEEWRGRKKLLVAFASW